MQIKIQSAHQSRKTGKVGEFKKKLGSQGIRKGKDIFNKTLRNFFYYMAYFQVYTLFPIRKLTKIIAINLNAMEIKD